VRGELVKTLISFIFFILSFKAMAIVNEISLDFGYDKQIYGTSRQNSLVTRSYSGGLATYIFSSTAIDLTYAASQDSTTENDRYNVATGFDIVGSQNRVDSTVYGVGLKQLFAPRTSFLIPALSIGYARQIVKYSTDYTVEDTTTKARAAKNYGSQTARYDSVTASFALQFKLTETLSLKGSVKTIFRAFEFNEAKNNLKYLFGFSWMF
jgi:hypothetical protein